ncbi:MAG: hypothetical protein KIT14_12015 [bacterium]|nr:hypothetical protein [bacterium]
MAVALAVAARGLERRTTWYLASDQFAFLTFAGDLAHGRVFHDPSALALLAGGTLPATPADAYYQTYIWNDGRLYTRYPPGYPALLAAAGLLGGEIGRHALNPVLYCVLPLVLFALARRMDAGLAAGAAVVWLLLLVPAEVHYWGLTVARDLPAHLLALGGVLAGLGGGLAASGLALGLAATIRPDAALWGLATGAASWRARPRPGRVAAASTAFLAGALPLFAYNTVTQGHPFAFTQGSEFRHVLSAAPQAFALASGMVSGGGFRLSHLADTLPLHADYLLRAFGALLLPAAGALVWALRARRPAVLALVPYAAFAFLFYSCWGHGDARYLVGVVLCLLLFAAVGVTRWAHWLATPGWTRPRRALAAVLSVAVVAAAPRVLPRNDPDRTRPVEYAVAAGLGLAGVVGLVAPGAAPLAAFAPALVLAGVGVARAASGSGERDAFQRAQVTRARTAIETLVPAGALVLTTPALGRPAENITHYTHAEAHYFGELQALGSTGRRTAEAYLAQGRRVFVLWPSGGRRPPLGGRRVVRSWHGGRALLDWFVDPRRAPDGADLIEVLGFPPIMPARPRARPGAPS